MFENSLHKIYYTAYILSAYLLYRLNKSVVVPIIVEVQKTVKERIYDKAKLLVKGYKLLFLNKKINFIVYLGILTRLFYICIPIMLLIFIKDTLHCKCQYKNVQF